MKRLRRIYSSLWLLLGIALSSACTAPPSSPPTPTPASAPSTSTAQDLGLHVLVDVQGKLTRTRPGWTEDLPLSLATTLSRADLLRAAADATGTVVCADLKTVAPIPGGYLGAAPCPQSSPLIAMRGDAVVVRPLRQTPDVLAVIPYVLTPRRSFIVEARPLLRWHDSTPGATYKVRVWGDTLNWEGSSTTPELRYPEDAPPLQPGVPYSVVVTDGSGRTSEEDKDATALDLSWERRRLQVWMEAMRASFEVPRVGRVDMAGGFVEVRWKFAPLWWVAGRLNRSVFDDAPGRVVAWDRDLTRLDIGIGWRATADLQFKVEYGHGRQSGGDVMGRRVFAAQMVLSL